MKAIETSGVFEKGGILRLAGMQEIKSQKVKVIILFNDDNEIDEELWLSSNAKNTSFDFLADEREDIYSNTDGKPIAK